MTSREFAIVKKMIFTAYHTSFCQAQKQYQRIMMITQTFWPCTVRDIPLYWGCWTTGCLDGGVRKLIIIAIIVIAKIIIGSVSKLIIIANIVIATIIISSVSKLIIIAMIDIAMIFINTLLNSIIFNHNRILFIQVKKKQISHSAILHSVLSNIKVALVIFVWLFSNVHFQIFPRRGLA